MLIAPGFRIRIDKSETGEMMSCYDGLPELFKITGVNDQMTGKYSAHVISPAYYKFVTPETDIY